MPAASSRSMARCAVVKPAQTGVPDGADGDLLGAVGVTGDTSDNDEAAAVAGIESAGLTAQTD